MRRVIAAIDNTATARPVLAVARMLSPLLDAEVEAVHVTGAEHDLASAAADAAGVRLEVLSGSVVPALTTACEPREVVALFIGSRGSPIGARPAGNTALKAITRVRKITVVVPPETPLRYRPTTVLVPLEGTATSTSAVEDAVRLALRVELDLIVLHVYDERTIPMFADQPQHENEAWSQEFLARYLAEAEGKATVQIRVGVAAEEIMRAAVDTGADLIAVGWSQDLTRGRAAVVRELLRGSRVPVVLLPVTRREEPLEGRSGSGPEG